MSDPKPVKLTEAEKAEFRDLWAGEEAPDEWDVWRCLEQLIEDRVAAAVECADVDAHRREEEAECRAEDLAEAERRADRAEVARRESLATVVAGIRQRIRMHGVGMRHGCDTGRSNYCEAWRLILADVEAQAVAPQVRATRGEPLTDLS